MRAGEIDILVGTQMVTKGHDLPNVTLVGVVNADAALSMPDFRAAERAFQLLVQVAGKGRKAGAAGARADPDPVRGPPGDLVRVESRRARLLGPRADGPL